MSEQMEKLVEELAQEMAFCYNEEGGLVRNREKARFYIDRIGKAYADGLEFPEMVGYYDDAHTPITFGQWAEDMFGDGARRFIALGKGEK